MRACARRRREGAGWGGGGAMRGDVRCVRLRALGHLRMRGTLRGAGSPARLGDARALFYQNVAEADYVVSVHEYMCRVGNPAGSIALLTTYNGQKALLRDMLRTRAHVNPALGEPAAVETVDRFHGLQADYVLLLLVRTRAVGHVRDVRRLVVARAQLAAINDFIAGDAAGGGRREP